MKTGVIARHRGLTGGGILWDGPYARFRRLLHFFVLSSMPEPNNGPSSRIGFLSGYNFYV